MKSNRKITRSEKKLFFVTGFAMLFIFAFGAWRQYVNAIPEVQIPTSKMPSPNAYDFYVKAGAAIVKVNPAVDPAYDTQTVPESQWKTRYPTAAKEAWLLKNAMALKLLRQGFRYPCQLPPQRSANLHGFTSYSKFREMARMLSVESRVRSEQGRRNKAAESALDILRLGHDISKGGVLIDFLVAVSINAIGRRDLWEILPHLNLREANFVVQRLEKLHQSSASFAEVLREEKYWGQSNLLEAMRSGQWPANDFLDEEKPTLLKRWQMVQTPRRVVVGNYTDYMDSLITAAQKPYGAKKVSPAIPDDIYNQELVPVFENSRLNDARDETGNALLLVALALRAYRLEHKRFPQNLNELVPRYLKKIPADAYGAGEPLRYKIVGAEYSLYSIGPDGIDNGGRAIEDKSKTGKGRYSVFEGKGDFVAGINH